MTEMARRYMGNSVPRKEDPTLLTGHSNFTDDIRLPGMLHMGFLRSPYAHARITFASRRLIPAPPGKKINEYSRGEEKQVGRRSTSGRQDKDEGAMDRAKGQMKEAAGALTDDKDTKAEGRADQRRGKIKGKKGNLKDVLK